jgi:uncharacterized protein (TIGR00730 family)
MKKKQPHSIEPTASFLNKEFLKGPDGRSIRILSEFLEPEVRFRRYGIQDTLVFFGSARTLPRKKAKENLKALEKKKKVSPEDLASALKAVEMSRYYEECVALAKKIGEWSEANGKRYSICSGGGPGIMEAANKGAKLAKAPSIGLNIELPFEQEANPYISPELNFDFHYFFVRKFWFIYLAKAIVMFPGGFGTLDEMMETLTLVQTQRITKKMVVILYGSEFWNRVVNFEYLAETGMIHKDDLKLFHICDDVDSAFKVLCDGLQEIRGSGPQLRE